METVRYSNGLELSWDETLTVGELITTYHAGYHVLLRVEPRKKETPLMYYKQVVRGDGTLVNRKAELSCDASYVRRVDSATIHDSFVYEVRRAELKRDNLMQFVTK